jgi:hypothetical protein
MSWFLKSQFDQNLVMINYKPNDDFKSHISIGGKNPYRCGDGALHRSEVYSTMVGTRSGPTLDGFIVIEKKKSIGGKNRIQHICKIHY